MTDGPLVTVLMPVFNEERFLGEAIASVQAQTCPDFELVVIDDGSSDDTPQILAARAADEPRLRSVRQENRGLAHALNHGLELARGRYLARLDADDRMAPVRLERQVSALSADPRLAIVGSAYRLVDENGLPGPVHSQPEGDTAIRWQVLFHSPFAHSSVMLRLDWLRSCGLAYDPQRVTEDYDLWSRLLEHGRGGNLSEALIDYRRHTDQMSEVQSAQFWIGASQVSQGNLQRLGVDLPIEMVETLRRWFYGFPAQIDPQEVGAALAMCDVLDRFVRRPGLDGREVRRIRGRRALKLLRGMRSLPYPTQREIVRRLGPGGLWAALRYGSERLRKGAILYTEDTD